MSDHLVFAAPKAHRGAALGLAAGAAVVAALGLARAPARTWPNLLLDGFFVLSLSVSALFFLATQRLCGARWSAGLRRIAEGFSLALPLGGALLGLLWLGRRSIYPWSREAWAHQHIDHATGSARYLEPPMVLLRMVAVVLVWCAFAWIFRRISLEQDREPHRRTHHHQRMNRYAALFLVVFAPSFTASAYDFLISLDPRWFSTIFAVYVFAGTFVQGIAAVTLAAVVLRERGFLARSVNAAQFHDLGKMLFAFSTFWAYLWVCQYLLIWYANLPEEVAFYVRRTSGSWLALFAINLVLNWVVPFLALMSRRAKTNLRILKVVAVVLLFGHWLDLYLLIMPNVWAAPSLGFVEWLLLAGTAALVYLLFVENVARAPLEPLHDPLLKNPAHP